MSYKKNLNTFLTNYSGCMNLNVSSRVKILNAFGKELKSISSRNHAFVFDQLDADDINYEPWIINYIDEPDTLTLNSQNFRSDEFKKEHDGKHILFAGCSVTYGTGLYSKEIWPYLVYNKIKEKEKVSGYYNISLPAISTFQIVADIFRYINNYSKPDVIFLNLPDVCRFYTVIENIVSQETEWKDKISLNKMENFEYFKDKYFHSVMPFQNTIDSAIVYEKFIYIYQYLLMLETFCKMNNIQLFIFSWSPAMANFLNSNAVELDSVYKTTWPSPDWIQSYKMKNKEDKFYLVARDKIHYGTAYHSFWSTEVYDFYMKENHVN